MIETHVSMGEWNIFERRWAIFKEGSHIADEDSSHHLFQCVDGLLSDSLLKMNPDMDVHEVLGVMKKNGC